jgi:light-regulated signal transduction histidine kinase (bacteriophytochrome)
MNNRYYELERSENRSEFERYRLKAKHNLMSRFNRPNDGLNNLERAIVKESDREVLKFIAAHLNLKLSFRSIILTTSTLSYIDDVDFDNVRAIINLEPTNQTRNQDKLFQAVNTLLPDAGIYIGTYHALSHAEELGSSLTKYGFEIVELMAISGLIFFVAIKTGESAGHK